MGVRTQDAELRRRPRATVSGPGALAVLVVFVVALVLLLANGRPIGEPDADGRRRLDPARRAGARRARVRARRDRPGDRRQAARGRIRRGGRDDAVRRRELPSRPRRGALGRLRARSRHDARGRGTGLFGRGPGRLRRGDRALAARTSRRRRRWPSRRTRRIAAGPRRGAPALDARPRARARRRRAGAVAPRARTVPALGGARSGTGRLRPDAGGPARCRRRHRAGSRSSSPPPRAPSSSHRWRSSPSSDSCARWSCAAPVSGTSPRRASPCRSPAASPSSPIWRPSSRSAAGPTVSSGDRASSRPPGPCCCCSCRKGWPC